MVVDDDDATREAFALVLSLAGYRVQTATNGLCALEQIRSSEHPHLIVLDLMMPLMDGAQFTRHLAQDEALAGIPVLVCSAAGERCRRVMPISPVAYLNKPIELPELVAAVRRHCG